MEDTLSDKAQLVKAQLEALWALQGLDDEMNQRRAEIARIQEQIAAEKKNADQHRLTLQERKDDSERLLKERRQAEVDAKEKQVLIQKLGNQLFEVKTNEAYSTLQNEIRQHKQENSLLEERILEIMLAEDELKAKIAADEAAVKETERQSLETQKGHQQEIKALETAIAEFQRQWSAAALKVKPEYLEQYQRLLKAKAGKALSKIENDICTGCRLSIRPQASIELRKYRGLLTCDNCARILYVE
ncbi:MAG: C4-type zinc ribbon domain-containing protein [candidate division FCPU426 bacterium]